MRRIILWIILGGIVLIAGVIVFQLFGTYLYMRSPARVVNGAFTRLIAAKSFDFTLEAADDAKDGLSFNVSGPLQKQVISKPVADLRFSFQAPDQTFYGNGQAQAKDGQLYLRFDQLIGLPDVLPGALQSLWTGINIDPLLAVGQDNLFPEASGSFTEADLEEVLAIAKRHLPFTPTAQGKPLFLDNALVIPYDIVLDRNALAALIGEIRSAVKDAPLSPKENADLARTVSALPPVSGQVWVSKNDGMLRALVLVVKGDKSSFHLNLRFSNYDRAVMVSPPIGVQPLAELFRRLFGTSLSGMKAKLPFDLPAPIWNIDMDVPVITPAAPGAAGEEQPLGGLPNLLKLFYGTDQLFAPKQ
jgi:hypothetical protein